ncbi:MAG TPA: hypothetical protein VII56_16350 [Rhizomicrobium sp.]
MTTPELSLRVFHPSIDPRKITEELGLPPQTSWAAGGDRHETYWQTRLAGNETGRGDLNSALRDVAARFEHYRFFVDEMREGGGRVEIVIAAPAVALDAELARLFDDLKIEVVFR